MRLCPARFTSSQRNPRYGEKVVGRSILTDMERVRTETIRLILLGLAALLAQAGRAQSFEVASIKPAPSLEEMVRSRQMHLGVNVDPAFADIGAFSLADLVGYAFRIRPFQISGPEWLNGQRFDIRAKLPDGATVDQVPEMVQSLLVERFHLTFHLENKEYPVYALLVGPKGPKLTVCPPDYERPAHGDVIDRKSTRLDSSHLGISY